MAKSTIEIPFNFFKSITINNLEGYKELVNQILLKMQKDLLFDSSYSDINLKTVTMFNQNSSSVETYSFSIHIIPILKKAQENFIRKFKSGITQSDTINEKRSIKAFNEILNSINIVEQYIKETKELDYHENELLNVLKELRYIFLDDISLLSSESKEEYIKKGFYVEPCIDYSRIRSFNNNFNKEVYTSIDPIVDHFFKALVLNNYLDNESFYLFIDYAFNKCEKIEKKLKFTRISRAEIIGFFYEFYNSTGSRKKNKYVKLLTDYFEDFEEDKVNNNFRTNNKL